MPGGERHALVVDGLVLGDLLQVLGRAVDLHGVLEIGHDAAGHGADLAEDVDCGLLHAVFGVELQILVVELQGDEGEHAGFGEREEIGAAPSWAGCCS